jgi:gliding motility-associated-like protein
LFLPYGNGRAITLVAVANNGCNDTLTIDSSSVVFDDSLMAMVPNVFTPNNDGTNDCFRPEVAGWFENCFLLYVYNRWGELIFESFREGHCWDGRTKGGNFAKEGTYFYVAKVRDLEFKGYVQLVK